MRRETLETHCMAASSTISAVPTWYGKWGTGTLTGLAVFYALAVMSMGIRPQVIATKQRRDHAPRCAGIDYGHPQDGQGGDGKRVAALNLGALMEAAARSG